MKRIIAVLMTAVLLSALFLTGCGEDGEYKAAMSLYENKQYQEAADKFSALGSYEDSEKMAKTCKYEAAMELFEGKSYEDALGIFKELGKYKKSKDYVDKCEHQINLEKYKDVYDALDGGTWFYEGSASNVIAGVIFTKEKVTYAEAFFDGNGKHYDENGSYSYSIDDKNIIVKDGKKEHEKIKYTLSGKTVKLGNKGSYFSTKDIDKEIQGYWNVRTTNYNALVRSFKRSEHTIYIHKGKLVSESASESAYSSDGAYFYYGPYKGKYKLNFGGFDTKMSHGSEWFFIITNGDVYIWHYDHACKMTDKLPGKNGYSF